jgi:hypothetical protein
MAAKKIVLPHHKVKSQALIFFVYKLMKTKIYHFFRIEMRSVYRMA